MARACVSPPIMAGQIPAHNAELWRADSPGPAALDKRPVRFQICHKFPLDLRLNNLANMNQPALGGLLIALLAAGCLLQSGCRRAPSTPEADKIVARHFQSVSKEDYASAAADYAARFFQKTSREDLIGKFSTTRTVLGSYKSHLIFGRQEFQDARDYGAGAVVVLQCQTTYANYPAWERFTLLKAPRDTEYKIVDYSIQSEGFMK
jgi:hypothetical protein